MDDLLNDYAKHVSEEVASFHDMHCRQFLEKNNIDPDAFLNDPAMLTKRGYRLLHEVNGEQHRLVLAKVIDEDNYIVRVRASQPPVSEEGGE